MARTGWKGYIAGHPSGSVTSAQATTIQTFGDVTATLFFKWSGEEVKLSETGELSTYALIMFGSLVLIIIYLITSIL